jgi:predicted transcriptional regulator
MVKPNIEDLPWRERQVVEVVYRLQEATATQIQEQLDEAPSNSAIRAMLSRLEEKGVLCHREEGQRFIYSAVQEKRKVADSALKKLVGVFYNNSPASAATALLGMSGKLSPQEINQLQALIDKAKKEGR